MASIALGLVVVLCLGIFLVGFTLMFYRYWQVAFCTIGAIVLFMAYIIGHALLGVING